MKRYPWVDICHFSRQMFTLEKKVETSTEHSFYLTTCFFYQLDELLNCKEKSLRFHRW